MTEKKQNYEKPAMQVYELQKHAPFVCMSGGGVGSPGNYGDGDDPWNPVS